MLDYQDVISNYRVLRVPGGETHNIQVRKGINKNRGTCGHFRESFFCFFHVEPRGFYGVVNKHLLFRRSLRTLPLYEHVQVVFLWFHI